MNSKIIINVFNKVTNEMVFSLDIDDHISNNPSINIMQTFFSPDGSVKDNHPIKGMDDKSLLEEYFSRTSNAVGEYTEIIISQLNPDDVVMFNELFSSKPTPYIIGDCKSFIVKPGVSLTTLPSTNNEKEEICPICLEDLYTNKKPVSYISGNRLDAKYCNHKFHTECITAYCEQRLAQGQNCACPLCRNNINLSDITKIGGKKHKRKQKKTKKKTKQNKTKQKRKQNKRKTKRRKN